MKQDTTSSSDLERRKHVKLRVREDLNIRQQRYEGRTYFVVKDPVSLRYYRFKEQEYYLLTMMNGEHTMDETQKDFEKRFRPERLTLEDLEQFGQQLLKAGLAQNDSPQAGKQLYDAKKKRRRSEILQAFTNILYIKAPLFDPERILSWMLPYLRWIFTKWFLTVSIVFFGWAIMLVLTHFDTFVARLPSYQEFFSFKNMAYMWGALAAVKVIHEFGHGLSCKAFGGEVHEMGFLILCFTPAMYCNVSDAWTLPNKWHRIIISFAGIYIELVIAAIAAIIWLHHPSDPFVYNLAQSLMIVCSVSTVVFNGNPLMRYDGYYVFADWMEIPNLRERSNRYLNKIVMDKCLGIETLPEPYMEPGRKFLFVSYAIISWFYRWSVTFVILQMTSQWLKPYKLEIISNALALWALGSMIGWPLVRLIKNISKRGRLPEMKPQRVTISAIVVAGFILAFFLVPLPVSRVRQVGVVQVQPETLDNIFVEEQGFLMKVNVKEGQTVPKDTVLAEFDSPELRQERESEQARAMIKAKLYDEYKVFLRKAKDRKEEFALKDGQDRIKHELDTATARIKEIDARLGRLVLRAPRAGIVVGLPKRDEFGKKWDRDSTEPFCSIGDTDRLRVLVPLSTADFEIVQEKKPDPLPVTIRIHGREDLTWQGNIIMWPSSAAKTVPIALTTRGGGPLAIKPGGEHQGQFIPQAQVFLVGIEILHSDKGICPGTLAQVKIHNRYRTCAWWSWRTLASMFDFGLI